MPPELLLLIFCCIIILGPLILAICAPIHWYDDEL